MKFLLMNFLCSNKHSMESRMSGNNVFKKLISISILIVSSIFLDRMPTNSGTIFKILKVFSI